MPKTITASNFTSEVIESDIPVLLDFYADWCMPCKMIAPVLEEIAKENPNIKVCKVNVDNEKSLAQEYKIMSIPTLMVFKNGKATATAMGARSKQELISLVEQN